MMRVAPIAFGFAVLIASTPAMAERAKVSGPALLEKARIAHFELDYARARGLLHRARRAAGHTPTSRARVFALLGRIAAAHGDADVAYRHFTRMLAADPEATLPTGLAPKIMAPFHRARADRARRPAPPPTRRRPPTRSAAQAPRPAVAVDDTISTPSPRPIYARWQTWGIAAVATGGAALYFGLRANEDWLALDQVIKESAAHPFDDAQRLERSGRRNQLVSNLASGAALTMTGVSLYLLFRGTTGERPRVSGSIGQRGASVSLRGRF